MLRRYQPSSRQPASARLLIKGDGLARYAEQSSPALTIVTPRFNVLTLKASVEFGGLLEINLDPHKALYFVPLESYADGYSYPMLETPVGLRFQMWDFALELFRHSPLLGVATGAYQTVVGKLVSAGRATPYAVQLDHPHNDYLDAMSNRGLVGLLALLALLGMPIWFFRTRLESSSVECTSAALSGLVVVVRVCGLTETLFIHSIALGWYLLLAVTMWVNAESG